MPQRTFWLKWSLSLHKLRESVTPVNTIRCTWWPSDWWWPMTSYCWHCVVLLQLECWKESAHHSCICSIITCSTTFNHIFIHLYINMYIITCKSSASNHIIVSCNIVSCQADILPVEFRQHRRKVPVRDRLPPCIRVNNLIDNQSSYAMMSLLLAWIQDKIRVAV